jgi:hypothetical protein
MIHQRITHVLLAVALLVTLRLPLPANESKFPSFSDVQQIVQSYFSKDRSRREDDIISRNQVAEVLKLLNNAGWKVPDEKQLLESVLDDQHVLVRTMRTPAGRKFYGKVSDRKLILDRLDRIAGVWGGPQLIQDLVKLPDGEKYAKPRSGGGVPDLLDLLPKDASGKTRRIASYDNPTGHIYTVADLISQLADRYNPDGSATP